MSSESPMKSSGKGPFVLGCLLGVVLVPLSLFICVAIFCSFVGR